MQVNAKVIYESYLFHYFSFYRKFPKTAQRIVQCNVGDTECIKATTNSILKNYYEGLILFLCNSSIQILFSKVLNENASFR